MNYMTQKNIKWCPKYNWRHKRAGLILSQSGKINEVCVYLVLVKGYQGLPASKIVKKKRRVKIKLQ